FIGRDERFPLWKQRRDEVLANILRAELTVDAISSYATLQTAVYAWLGRPSAGPVSGSIPDLISMFERTAFRRLRALNETMLPLSGINQTNWLLTNHPDAYLYGTLAAAEPFLSPDDPLVGMWKAQREEILEEILRDDLKVTAIVS